jgi:hypothetical protein
VGGGQHDRVRAGLSQFVDPQPGPVDGDVNGFETGAVYDQRVLGVARIRLGPDGIRRPDLRAQLTTDDGELILFRYDLAIIRSSERFLSALAAGEASAFGDQYMRIAPHFEVGAGRYRWLAESLFLGRGRLIGPRSIAYDFTACSELAISPAGLRMRA